LKRMTEYTVPPKLYLLDVEGTVAPLTLTSEVLFPYARAHFEQFLWANEAEIEAHKSDGEDSFAENDVWLDLFALALENRNDSDPAAPRILPVPMERSTTDKAPRVISMSPREAIPRFLEYIDWLMDRDRKSTALKSLQGKIWKAGFESGELKGTLFEDVPAALQHWSANGRVAIYSSGSVEAQRLLFRHSIFGDLTGVISDYFDTRSGPKQASASYAAIAVAMETEPQEIVFFSDIVKELDAAREAGCQTRLVVREGNAPVDDPREHEIVESFFRL